MNKIKENLSIIVMGIFGAMIGVVNLTMGMNLFEIIGAMAVSFGIAWAVELKFNPKKEDLLKGHVLSKKPEGSESDQKSD